MDDHFSSDSHTTSSHNSTSSSFGSPSGADEPGKQPSRVGMFVGVGLVSLIVSAITAAIVFLFVSQGPFDGLPFPQNTGIPDIDRIERPVLTPEEEQAMILNVVREDQAIISIAKKTSPAVVSVVITKEVPVNGFGPFGFFSPEFGNGQDTTRQEVGGGSGFVVRENGLIVTNKHVISDEAAQFTVITNDGNEYEATVLAKDPAQDIAILQIDATGLPTLEFGDSDDVEVGQTVIAIGNSLAEFSNSVSRGIVSGLGRNIIAGERFGETERLSGIIQTDAAINPGNSGGPLLNIEGRVIGVNTAVAQGAENVGFAIPANRIVSVLEQVETTGKISAPFIGVRYLVIDKQLQQQGNLPFDYGVLIVRGQTVTDFAVTPGSPADVAGLNENDIILEIDGKRITAEKQLGDHLLEYSPGDSVSLKVWSAGEEKTISLTLAERE